MTLDPVLVKDIQDRLLNPRKLKSTTKIGNGAFGTVYLMTDPNDNCQYAVKTESRKTKVPQLEIEFKAYRKLLQSPGIPIAYALWEGKNQNCKEFADDSELRYLAMQPCGPSLDKFIKDINETNILWIAEQTVNAIQSIHKSGILHRDIKPENLLTGINGLQSKKIYVVDFGLCKSFITKDGYHIPEIRNKKLTGTARYASVHTHLGLEQSRRDDLESLGYVIVYLLNQYLPWMGVKGETKKEQHKNIMDIKIKTSVDELCKNVPKPISVYLKIVKQLKFDSTPDYTLLKSLFKHIT